MRRSRAVRWSLLAAALAATLGTAAVQAVRWHEREITRAEFEAGRQLGISEAALDLFHGTAHHYVTGERWSPSEGVDPTSGLPNQTIAACVVTQADLGRATGYNETVEAGAPVMSHRPAQAPRS